MLLYVRNFAQFLSADTTVEDSCSHLAEINLFVQSQTASQKWMVRAQVCLSFHKSIPWLLCSSLDNWTSIPFPRPMALPQDVSCLPAFWPHPGNLQMSFKPLLGVGSCFPFYRLPLTPAWWHQKAQPQVDRLSDACGLAGLLSANTGWETDGWGMEKSMPLTS